MKEKKKKKRKRKEKQSKGGLSKFYFIFWFFEKYTVHMLMETCTVMMVSFVWFCFAFSGSMASDNFFFTATTHT